MSTLTGPADLRVAQRLADLEVVIERGKAAFIEVGEALLEIRESKLYRLDYPTFEDYCQKRWGWSRVHGDRLIQAAEVVRALPPTGGIPDNEGQARELVPLKGQPDVLRTVWAGVIEQAEATETPVTAPIIREAVRDYIRGQAAASEAEMQEAAGWMSESDRAAVGPEQMRQRGELMRLIRAVGALPEPIEYAHRHAPYLPEDFMAEAAFACGWLEFFCDALEGKR